MTDFTNKPILKVCEFLQLQNVTIPAYQRPYKWTLKNVSHLFLDIRTQKDKSAYRLGTIVFHSLEVDKKQQLDVVDGQQRTLTLMLIVKAIIQTRLDELERKDVKEQLKNLAPFVNEFLNAQKFSSKVSQHNLHQNYFESTRLVSRNDFTESHIDFLLNQCEVVVFRLHDISEAFQFFDSQNARGRDLEPHDLLKAFHLREFAEHESELKADTVAHWEKLPSDELAELFAVYLYRIRQWGQGKTARYFGKNQVDEFKGVNLDNVANFPYVESLRITHHFVDDYNNQYHRKIDSQNMRFPFHLDQMVINGRRFFEMAEHYQQQISVIVGNEHDLDEGNSYVTIESERLSELATRIVRTLNNYERRVRVGDRYVRSIFDCAVVSYMDKFGSKQLSTAIEKIFVWAYACRIRQQVVQLATIDKYILSNNIFRVIKDATQPIDVLSMALEVISSSENKNNIHSGSSDEDPLVVLFKDMKYYD